MAFFDNKSLTTLQKEKSEWLLEKQALEADILDYQKTIDDFLEVKSKHETQLSNLKNTYDGKVRDLTKNYETKVSELSTKLEVEQKSVNRKVNIALGNIGVRQFAPEEIVPIQQESDIYKTFLQMPNGKEKDEYFKKNEFTISRALRLK